MNALMYGRLALGEKAGDGRVVGSDSDVRRRLTCELWGVREASK